MHGDELLPSDSLPIVHSKDVLVCTQARFSLGDLLLANCAGMHNDVVIERLRRVVCAPPREVPHRSGYFENASVPNALVDDLPD